jgi:hypothetical protein
MEKGKDYISVKTGDDVPTEWQDKIDSGQAIKIVAAQPKFTGPWYAAGLAIPTSLVLGYYYMGLSADFAVPVLGVLVVTGLAFCHTASQILARVATQLRVSEAVLDVITTKINDLADGTKAPETGLKEDGTSTESVH